jgi:hypothetical protein
LCKIMHDIEVYRRSDKQRAKASEMPKVIISIDSFYKVWHNKQSNHLVPLQNYVELPADHFGTLFY